MTGSSQPRYGLVDGSHAKFCLGVFQVEGHGAFRDAENLADIPSRLAVRRPFQAFEFSGVRITPSTTQSSASLRRAYI